MHVCVPHFYDLSALVGCWSSVSMRRIIYKFLNVCPLDYTAVAVSGKVERSYTGLTTPVGLTAATPTDRPKSVRNRCVIKVFGGVFYVVMMLLGFFSVGVGAFVIGLSHISSIFSLKTCMVNNHMSITVMLPYRMILGILFCSVCHFVCVSPLGMAVGLLSM